MRKCLLEAHSEVDEGERMRLASRFLNIGCREGSEDPRRCRVGWVISKGWICGRVAGYASVFWGPALSSSFISDDNPFEKIVLKLGRRHSEWSLEFGAVAL
mmetsp:Transcript_42344/g.83163  ORF Transcript_42344/g.83163 Transcript_42344/m.83163 type:complete len:101 (-) Transcript_42344:115-417(-)